MVSFSSFVIHCQWGKVFLSGLLLFPSHACSVLFLCTPGKFLSFSSHRAITGALWPKADRLRVSWQVSQISWWRCGTGCTFVPWNGPLQAWIPSWNKTRPQLFYSTSNVAARWFFVCRSRRMLDVDVSLRNSFSTWKVWSDGVDEWCMTPRSFFWSSVVIAEALADPGSLWINRTNSVSHFGKSAQRRQFRRCGCFARMQEADSAPSRTARVRRFLSQGECVSGVQMWWIGWHCLPWYLWGRFSVAMTEAAESRCLHRQLTLRFSLERWFMKMFLQYWFIQQHSFLRNLCMKVIHAHMDMQNISNLANGKRHMSFLECWVSLSWLARARTSRNLLKQLFLVVFGEKRREIKCRLFGCCHGAHEEMFEVLSGPD